MRSFDVPEDLIKIDPRDFSINNRLKPEYVLKVNNAQAKKPVPKKPTQKKRPINTKKKVQTKNIEKPKNTTQPKSTERPKNTVRPKSTEKPKNTVQPKKTTQVKRASRKSNPNPNNLPAIRKKKKSLGKKIVLNVLFYIFIFIVAVVAGYNAVFYLFTI